MQSLLERELRAYAPAQAAEIAARIAEAAESLDASETWLTAALALAGCPAFESWDESRISEFARRLTRLATVAASGRQPCCVCCEVLPLGSRGVCAACRAKAIEVLRHRISTVPGLL